MKIFLTKDVEKIGFAGEIVDVKDGFAANYIVPNKLGILVTAANEAQLKGKIKQVQNRKAALATKTSMLAEQIKGITLTIKRKIHDDEKIYGSIGVNEIADLLAAQGIKVEKNQILLDKPIKTKGTFDIVLKLSKQLQPVFKLKVQPE